MLLNVRSFYSLLNVALEDQKAAIATLVDLRKSGMTEDEIADLTRVVSKWSGKTQDNGPSFKLDTDIIMPPTETHGARQ